MKLQTILSWHTFLHHLKHTLLLFHTWHDLTWSYHVVMRCYRLIIPPTFVIYSRDNPFFILRPYMSKPSNRPFLNHFYHALRKVLAMFSDLLTQDSHRRALFDTSLSTLLYCYNNIYFLFRAKCVGCAMLFSP